MLLLVPILTSGINIFALVSNMTSRRGRLWIGRVKPTMSHSFFYVRRSQQMTVQQITSDSIHFVMLSPAEDLRDRLNEATLTAISIHLK